MSFNSLLRSSAPFTDKFAILGVVVPSILFWDLLALLTSLINRKENELTFNSLLRSSKHIILHIVPGKMIAFNSLLRSSFKSLAAHVDYIIGVIPSILFWDLLDVLDRAFISIVTSLSLQFSFEIFSWRLTMRQRPTATWGTFNSLLRSSLKNVKAVECPTIEAFNSLLRSSFITPRLAKQYV